LPSKQAPSARTLTALSVTYTLIGDLLALWRRRGLNH
jgi:hypothetical protein